MAPSRLGAILLGIQESKKDKKEKKNERVSPSFVGYLVVLDGTIPSPVKSIIFIVIFLICFLVK